MPPSGPSDPRIPATRSPQRPPACVGEPSAAPGRGDLELGGALWQESGPGWGRVSLQWMGQGAHEPARAAAVPLWGQPFPGAGEAALLGPAQGCGSDTESSWLPPPLSRELGPPSSFLGSRCLLAGLGGGAPSFHRPWAPAGLGRAAGAGQPSGNARVWLTTQNHSTLVTERSAVPFLPVNPEYSATRNQGRQKLARFNAREFATLIIDILSEAKRRQQGKSLGSPTDTVDYPVRSQSDPDDQHDYDSVASDEDTDQEPLRSAARNNRARSMDSSELSDGPITLQEYLEVKKALAASEAKVQQLMKVNNSLSDELRRLQREIHKLQAENTQMRQQPGPGHAVPTPSERSEHGHGVATAAAHRRDRQAFSMYEPGSALKPFGQPVDELVGRLQPFHSSEVDDEAVYSTHIPASGYRIRKGVSASSVPFPPSSPLLSGMQDGARHMTSKLDRHGSGTDSDYDNTQAGETLLSMDGKRFLDLGKDDDFHAELEALDGELDPGLPSTEDVILKTEQVTKNIQELLRAAQEFKHDSFVPCSEKIHSAVTEMASLFPKKPALETVRSSLRLLNASAYRLQSECRKTMPPEPGAPVDYQLLTQQVIQCAYDIAKAAKQLVTITTREKKQ
ncbi:ARF GTPase-activating protein GIT1 isoform X5 [Chrysemys picta bellii]|uniref:ARF GTPase-activating protein GIT1 isoform X5 n=1 Tax=Chrysemys picta bellii TaxID=8478 RepID=UPI0032B21581